MTCVNQNENLCCIQDLLPNKRWFTQIYWFFTKIYASLPDDLRWFTQIYPRGLRWFTWDLRPFTAIYPVIYADLLNIYADLLNIYADLPHYLRMVTAGN